MAPDLIGDGSNVDPGLTHSSVTKTREFSEVKRRMTQCITKIPAK